MADPEKQHLRPFLGAHEEQVLDRWVLVSFTISRTERRDQELMKMVTSGEAGWLS